MRAENVTVEVEENLDALSDAAAGFTAQYIMDRARTEDRVSIALSGGTTPRGVYERLASEKFRDRIPWNRMHLFWGDERCVPPDHSDSNYLSAYKTFISRVPIPAENVHRMPGEKEPEKAAEEYEHTLRDFFRSSGEWPAFDIVLLGIGPDGHTASLFPGSSALKEKKRWVAAAYVEKLRSHRLTLTLPVLNHARQVVFLAAGKEKAAVLKEWAPAGHSSPEFPFQLIQPGGGRLAFFIDKEAGIFLNREKKS